MKKFKILFCFFVFASCVLNCGGLVRAEVIKPEFVEDASEKELSKEEQIARYREHLVKEFKEDVDMYTRNDGSEQSQQPQLEGFSEFCFDLEKLKPLVDKLKCAIDEFVAKSNCTAEDFNSYVIENMATTGGKMNCVSRQEFNQLFHEESVDKQIDSQSNVNANSGEVQPKMKRFYRGINDPAGVESFRNGNIYIGGNVRGSGYDAKSASALGHGIYVAEDKSTAINFSCKEKNFKAGSIQALTGGIVEMAVDESKVKVIDNGQIKLLKTALLYYYPEFGDAYKFWNKGVSFYLFNSSIIELYAQAYEKVFGGKLIDIVKHCGAKSDGSDIYSVERVLCTLLPANSVEFSRELETLMNKNTKKAHYLKKEVAVYDDPGLIAKILGFDVLRSGPDSDIYNVVNPGVLTVCREAVEKEEKSIEQLIQEFKNKES